MNDILLLKQYCQPLSVLYVEDEKELNASVVRYLSKIFGHVESAYDGKEGFEKYSAGTFDIVLTDINMPKMNGIELARSIKALNPQQAIIIVSAYAETKYFMDAIHIGISDYVIKPISYEQMNSVLYKLASVVQMIKENKQFHESLYTLVDEQTKSITENYELTIKAMVDIVESRDTYTGGHSDRVAKYSKAIAQEMNFSEEDCELVFRAGMLHDIGKVATPDSILLKPGKLSARELDLIKNHVVVSYELLSRIPMYAKLAEIVQSHHERYDGHGYPNGLKGNEMPLLARVMTVADAFDAMTTNRIYKGRMSLEMALSQIQEGSGTQFDPLVVPFAIKALSRIVLDEYITQLPQNSMEEERFAYYYHDPLTGSYNKDYLILFLQSLSADDHYNGCIHFLKNFSQYNKIKGWEEGNILLKVYAEHLVKQYPGVMIFRIHGDDFALISKEPLCDKPDACSQPSFFDDSGVGVQCHCLTVGSDFMEQLKEMDMNK